MQFLANTLLIYLLCLGHALCPSPTCTEFVLNREIEEGVTCRHAIGFYASKGVPVDKSCDMVAIEHVACYECKQKYFVYYD